MTDRPKSSFVTKMRRKAEQAAASWSRRILGRSDARYLNGFASLKAHKGLSKNAQSLLAGLIAAGEPLCVTRFGLTELDVFRRSQVVKTSGPLVNFLDLVATGNPVFSGLTAKKLMASAGLDPFSEDIRKAFGEVMADSIRNIDVLASWLPGESWFAAELEATHVVDIEDLAPYHFDNPWSAALEGKRVLVVHPYTETIQRQYSENRTQLFANPKVLPEFELLTYRPPQAYHGEIRHATQWFRELDTMTDNISNISFDVALIGAGPFGMPLASRIKSFGRQAIHLGGTTQVLFGIIGERWLKNPAVARHINDSWVRPSASETPDNPGRVEKSAYW